MYDFLKEESDETKIAVNEFNNKVDVYNEQVEDFEKINEIEKLNYEQEYEDRLCILLVNIINKNACNNDIKANYIFKGKIALSICFFLIFSTLSIYSYNYFN